MNRLWLALAIAFACNGSGVELEGTPGTLAGRITVGPFCPVEVEGEPCPPPPGTYESIAILVYTRESRRLVADAVVMSARSS